MRLMFYYSLHTTWNQLRKLFRTWLFLLVLCVLLGGGLIGFGAARFSSSLNTVQPSGETALPESFMDFFDASGLTANDAIELGTGVLFLALLTMQVLGAEKSVSRLFLPADVNFLFASDLTPQQVLSFRLFTTLGTAIVASVYLFFQLPSLSQRFSIPWFASVMFLVSWCFAIAFSILLKILTFEVSSNHPFLKNNLRYFILGFLAILFFALYHSYHTSSEQVFLLSAHRFFNAEWTRWIPIWGWLKGMVRFALDGNTSACLVLTALSLALIGVMVVLVRVMPVDYYEEATIRCEEIALYMETVNSENAGLLVTRKKQFSETLERDGFHYGEGASIYFHKTLYNRRRFARFGILTRTMITYTLIAIAGGLFVRMFMEEPSIYPPVFLLAVTAFFRTVASPMSEDIRRDSFHAIPENTWMKLLYSLLGGSLNCALDAAVPLMFGVFAAGFFPLRGLLFLPLIVSVDFFATAVGTFVDVAIPASLDKSLKQVIQILFLYFGMIPDEMIIAMGLISNHTNTALFLACMVNLLLGLLFFGLAGVWLDPSPGLRVRLFAGDSEKAKAACTRLGFALVFMYLSISLAQGLTSWICNAINGGPILSAFAMYLPISLIGLPVFILSTRNMEWIHFEGNPISMKHMALIFSMCVFLMYSGNFLGMIVTGFLHRTLSFLPSIPHPAGSLDPDPALSAFFLTIISPLVEEYVFRRCLIDRLRPYGEFTALILSALLFALFHANFSQFFYALLLGLVFGGVYLKTGKLRYSMTLHMIINFMGSVLAPGFLVLLTSALPAKPYYEITAYELLTNPMIMMLLCYLMILVILFLLGTVVTAHTVKNARFSKDGITVKEALESPGMISFVTLLAVLMFLSL